MAVFKGTPICFTEQNRTHTEVSEIISTMSLLLLVFFKHVLLSLHQLHFFSLAKQFFVCAVTSLFETPSLLTHRVQVPLVLLLKVPELHVTVKIYSNLLPPKLL